jgi:hypothetical protein
MRMFICILQSHLGEREIISCHYRQQGSNSDVRYHYCATEQNDCAYIRYFDVPKFIPEKQKTIETLPLQDGIQTTQTL